MSIKLALWFSFFFSKIILPGFAVNTPVKTFNGMIPIQDVKIDASISYNIPTTKGRGQTGACKIYNTMRYVENEYVLLIIGGSELVRCSKKQQFFLYEKMDWVEARYLRPGYHLIAENNRKVSIDFIEGCNDGIELFDLGTDHERYCATSEEVLVHNMPQFFWSFVNYVSGKFSSSKASFNFNLFGFWFGMGYKGEEVNENLEKKYQESDHCCKHCRDRLASRYDYLVEYEDVENSCMASVVANNARALKNSVKIDDSDRRIGIDNGQIVLFQHAYGNKYIGKVKKWSQLDKQARRALVILNRVVDICKKEKLTIS